MAYLSGGTARNFLSACVHRPKTDIAHLELHAQRPGNMRCITLHDQYRHVLRRVRWVPSSARRSTRRAWLPFDGQAAPDCRAVRWLFGTYFNHLVG